MKLKHFSWIATAILLLNLPTATTANSAEGLKIWQPCVSATEDSCLEALTLISPTGERIQAQVTSEIRTYQDAFARQQLVGSAREWRTPGVIHENLNDRVILKVFYFPGDIQYCWTNVNCSTGIDEIVVDLAGAWWGNGRTSTHFPEEESDLQCGSLEVRTLCTPGWGINPDYEYEIIMRTPTFFNPGMSVGEGLNGNLQTLETNANFNRVLITSKPALRSFRWTRYNASGPQNFDLKADVSINIINYYLMSTKNNNLQWLSRCGYGKGMSIWHNGAIRSYPHWNAKDQSLSMQLAGMHLKPDGSPNIGTFNISVPLDVAQCIWGVDLSKKTSAMMSATYDNSSQAEIISLTSTVRNKNFIMTGNGFHYSTPTLAVKLKQEAPVVVTSTPKPSPSSTNALTAICTKGKILKKLSSSNAKCPIGFKKSFN